MEDMMVILDRFSKLSVEEADCIKALTEPLQLGVGDTFLLSDHLTGAGIAFLQEGILFSSATKSTGSCSSSNILIAAGSFLSNKYIVASAEDVLLAVAKTRLLILDEAQCEILSFLVPQWDRILDKIQITVLMNRLERIAIQSGGTAKSRYLNLVEHYPFVAQQVPLQYIATHLGITRQSLSRIRHNLAYNH